MPPRPPPIFVAAFSRGGSSLVWNLLQSHESIVSPMAETHQLFIGNADDGSNRKRFAIHARHMLRGAGWPHPQHRYGALFANFGLFDPGNYAPRVIPPSMRPDVRERISAAVAETLRDPWHRFKSPDSVYASEELAGARLVGKNINGINCLNPSLAEMYPGAVFVGLMRSGLALCESRVRRGTAGSVDRFAAVYATLATLMVDQARTLPNFRLFRFEDLLANPEKFCAALFGHVGIADPPEWIRLKNKGHYRRDGAYGPASGSESPYWWFPRAELTEHLSSAVDDAQVRRLSLANRSAFERVAGEVMAALDYA